MRVGHYRPPAGRGARPDFGSVVSKMRRGDVRALPPYVALDKTAGDEYRNGPAYLGVSHKAFIATGKLEGLTRRERRPRHAVDPLRTGWSNDTSDRSVARLLPTTPTTQGHVEVEHRRGPTHLHRRHIPAAVPQDDIPLT